MSHKKETLLGVLCLFCALYLGISLVFFDAPFSSGIMGVLLTPGRILRGSFSWASYYIPCYLALCAVFILFPVSIRRWVPPLLTTVLPFISISLILRLMEGENEAAAAVFLITALGYRGSLILLYLLTVLFIFLVAYVWVLVKPKGPNTFSVKAADKEQPLTGKPFSGPSGSAGLSLVPENDKDPAGVLESASVSETSLPSRIREELELSMPAVVRRESPAEEALDYSPSPEEECALKGAAAEDAETITGAENPEIHGDGEQEDPEGAEYLGEDPEEDSEEYAEEEYTAGAPLVADNLYPGEALEFSGPETRDREGSGRTSRPASKTAYSVPVEELLNDYPDGQYWVVDEDTRLAADVLKETLEEFRIKAEVTGIRKGPVITMFEILPAPGVKLSKIVNLADNIALRLAASRVRIVAPIPGKHAVGIEVPNKHRAIVSFKELIDSELFEKTKMEIPVILGKDITGEGQIIDLVQTPHLLIAGATGSGKSVCVNSIICSILYKRKPAEVKMILIDPKIVELKLYNDIPHLLTPVITEPKRAFQALQYCIYEMERRYSLLDALGVRDIRSYNRKIKNKNLATLPLAYIVIIIDEFADLMATTGKELEATLARLAAMSRAVGIHIVLATQRPSIDVITGLIKANIPSRIAFMVAGKFDSRIIIDAVGAEKLLGRGDMLFTSAWDPNPNRIQGAYLSEEEVEKVSDYIKTLGEPEYIDDEIFIDEEEEEFTLESDTGYDPLFEKALEIVSQVGKASASYLQRRLKIGYNRAARLVEEMERRGIVGPQNGSKPRDLIHLPDKFKE